MGLSRERAALACVGGLFGCLVELCIVLRPIFSNSIGNNMVIARRRAGMHATIMPRLDSITVHMLLATDCHMVSAMLRQSHERRTSLLQDRK